MNNIPFNIPFLTGLELDYINKAMRNKKLSGDGAFTKACNQMLLEKTRTKAALLTTSCTHALEMAAILLGIKPGDEVIMPSYNFVSTANAFVLRGAKIVFVDVHPETMNINENLIESAISEKTKCIVPVHYGGVGCEMDEIMRIAQKYGLFIVEDAAQGVGSTYKGKPLGSIGDLGALSFHDTKNIHCGEGGALLINNPKYKARAEIIREKGTNRSRFFRGEIDKYSWVDIGSSYLPSELNAAFLFSQLREEVKVTKKRRMLWNYYFTETQDLEKQGHIELAKVPDHCQHNGHLFFIKCRDGEERQALIDFLIKRGVHAVFHYIPLHSAEAGEKLGTFHGEDQFTTKGSERLLRLPMFFELRKKEQNHICQSIYHFYEGS